MLVHLNGYIYAIGGIRDSYGGDSDSNFPLEFGVGSILSSDCERFDIARNKWKKIAPLPPHFAATSAIAYQGRILVYSTIYDQHDYYEYALETKRYEIWVYNPNKNEWQSKFSESDNTTDKLTQPVLVVHKDQCYRVVFRIIPRGDETDYLRAYRGLPKEEQAVVNLLKLHSSRSDVMSGVSLGEEIKQDFIEPNTLGAFRIGEDVFVTTCGDVQQTDLKIHKDEDEDIDLGKWKRFAKPYKRGSNIVNFTCDWKN
ncbi:uncharacterized protein [Amphiura filiformis]|uniref:uncharacterized protein n=1 Tax=Amphiura filiformis TaxID=82378 RepID=UPI003B216949